MKIQPVKGTRDFYPPQMAIRNYILDGWKSASKRNGFEEYDGPIFEYLKMYQVKSGDEIVEQLFNFKDRGDRHLAIRPEITPTLARMVTQQINALPRPIKWFSLPRLCRAERPQKGRLREFFQWNVDIIGIDDIRADAEVIFTTIDYLRSAGLGSDVIKVKISSRRLLAEFLVGIGISEDKLESIYPILDKKPKMSAEAFNEMLSKAISDSSAVDKVIRFMNLSNIDEVYGIFEGHPKNKGPLLHSISELRGQRNREAGGLFDLLEKMGVGDYCVFDPTIVRGLAYYTGPVFEVHDVVGELRAVCGGGRYDNLLKDFGGPAVSATGMGMGDAVLEILLRENGLLENIPATRELDYFVAFTDKQLQQKAIEITAQLRSAGLSAEFSYKGGNLGKQVKQASVSNAKNCLILGQEYLDRKCFVMKDMQTGQQKELTAEDFLSLTE